MAGARAAGPRRWRSPRARALRVERPFGPQWPPASRPPTARPRVGSRCSIRRGDATGSLAPAGETARARSARASAARTAPSPDAPSKGPRPSIPAAASNGARSERLELAAQIPVATGRRQGTPPASTAWPPPEDARPAMQGETPARVARRRPRARPCRRAPPSRSRSLATEAQRGEGPAPCRRSRPRRRASRRAWADAAVPGPPRAHGVTRAAAPPDSVLADPAQARSRGRRDDEPRASRSAPELQPAAFDQEPDFPESGRPGLASLFGWVGAAASGCSVTSPSPRARSMSKPVVVQRISPGGASGPAARRPSRRARVSRRPRPPHAARGPSWSARRVKSGPARSTGRHSRAPPPARPACGRVEAAAQRCLPGADTLDDQRRRRGAQLTAERTLQLELRLDADAPRQLGVRRRRCEASALSASIRREAVPSFGRRRSSLPWSSALEPFVSRRRVSITRLPPASWRSAVPENGGDADVRTASRHRCAR